MTGYLFLVNSVIIQFRLCHLLYTGIELKQHDLSRLSLRQKYKYIQFGRERFMLTQPNKIKERKTFYMSVLSEEQFVH